MQECDVEQIMKIEEASFGEIHWSRDSFCNEIENKIGNYFVALEDCTDKVIGYCGFWGVIDEAHITTLAVDKDFHKMKVGEALLQHMIKVAYTLDMKWFTLEVRISNLPALSLYKKYGFDSLGVREKYYQDNNEDAVIMWTNSIWSDKFKESFGELQKALEERITLVSC
jgi:ribosomal-protein-alanine N-acetyltransferase